MEIQNEIDKLLTLKESFSKIAGSYSSLVPKEFVTIQLHAEKSTDLSAYKVKVVNTTSGNEEFYDISASGYTEFEIKYDSVYEIVFPIISAYITPATRTFTAQKPMRKIEASYVMAGVFGLDEQGNRYSLEQIEALEDKSIIKYGGYTDEYLERILLDNQESGCGFMWKIGEEYAPEKLAWSDSAVEFNQELLPYFVDITQQYTLCRGVDYTDYIIREGVRLNVTTPAASYCKKQSVVIDNNTIYGFFVAYGQFRRLCDNVSLFNALYTAINATAPDINGASTTVSLSCQRNLTHGMSLNNGKYSHSSATLGKIYKINVFVCYPLPK